VITGAGVHVGGSVGVGVTLGVKVGVGVAVGPSDWQAVSKSSSANRQIRQ
jgi:hypothetical protein